MEVSETRIVLFWGLYWTIYGNHLAPAVKPKLEHRLSKPKPYPKLIAVAYLRTIAGVEVDDRIDLERKQFIKVDSGLPEGPRTQLIGF